MKTIITWDFVVTDEVKQIMEIHLFENGKDVLAVVDLDDQNDRILDLCIDIQDFVNQYPDLTYEIKNDGDNLGIIVDIWEEEECVDTACFWFEDYMSELGI